MNALREEINPGKLYAYGLWTKHEIKMVEYWQNFFLVCLLTKTQKRRIMLVFSLLDRTSSINKAFIIWHKKHHFLTGNSR